MSKVEIDVVYQYLLEIKDSEMFGGPGSIGHSSVELYLKGEDFHKLERRKYERGMIQGYAKLFEVPSKKIRIVDRIVHI